MTALLRPKAFRRLLTTPTQFVALNVTTAIAWLCFFFGLKHLEPAVVATLSNGIGPLAVVIFGALDWIKSENGFSKAEGVCYAGTAICLMSLSFVVLTSRSGLSTSNPLMQGLALLSSVVGGVMISVSHIIARELNEKGVGSYAVMGARFLLTFLVAIVVEVGAGQAGGRRSML
jgi:drug/metabolite transporter (DMT)-like permease